MRNTLRQDGEKLARLERETLLSGGPHTGRYRVHSGRCVVCGLLTVMPTESRVCMSCEKPGPSPLAKPE